MTTDQIQALINRAAKLPAEAQAEIAQSISDIEAKYTQVYNLDDAERAEIAESDEDVRLGRFASPEEVAKVFSLFDRP